MEQTKRNRDSPNDDSSIITTFTQNYRDRKRQTVELQEEVEECEKKIAELERDIEDITRERDGETEKLEQLTVEHKRTVKQYAERVEQLQREVQNIPQAAAEKIEELELDLADAERKRKQEKTRHKNELEKLIREHQLEVEAVREEKGNDASVILTYNNKLGEIQALHELELLEYQNSHAEQQDIITRQYNLIQELRAKTGNSNDRELITKLRARLIEVKKRLRKTEREMVACLMERDKISDKSLDELDAERIEKQREKELAVKELDDAIESLKETERRAEKLRRQYGQAFADSKAERDQAERDIAMLKEKVETLTRAATAAATRATKAHTAFSKKVAFLQEYKHIMFKKPKPASVATCINCSVEPAKFCEAGAPNLAFCGEKCHFAHISSRSGKVMSKKKAREILHHGSVHGQPLTDRQRRYFGWLSTTGGSD